MSLELANKYNCEIICADSMTVYREMNIGTDKPEYDSPSPRHSRHSTLRPEPHRSVSKSEGGNPVLDSSCAQNDERFFQGVRHHLLDIVNPDEEFNVVIFVEKVKTIVADIYSRGKVPMLVGGSVMYIDAYIYDYQMPSVAPDAELRAKLDSKTEEELFKQLCGCDPDCEWTVDRHNKRRIIRAIEVCHATGKPLAEQKSKKPLPENVLYLAVEKEREELYAQIDTRVDAMFRQGFVDEVRALHTKYDHNTAMQAAGYRQIIQFLDGKIDLETAISKTKQVHRNYAKRQLTWLRRNEDIHWVKNTNEAKDLIDVFLR